MVFPMTARRKEKQTLVYHEGCSENFGEITNFMVRPFKLDNLKMQFNSLQMCESINVIDFEWSYFYNLVIQLVPCYV